MVDSHIAKVNYILHRQMPVLERYAWQTPLSAKKGRISVYLEESRDANMGEKDDSRTRDGFGELVDGTLMMGTKEKQESVQVMEGW